MTHYARRIDRNHGEIRNGLLHCGYELFDAFRLGYGWPDLYVRSKSGAWVWIEVKMPGEPMTEAEARWWKRYDGPGMIAYSLEQALEWLNKMDEGGQNASGNRI